MGTVEWFALSWLPSMKESLHVAGASPAHSGSMQQCRRESSTGVASQSNSRSTRSTLPFRLHRGRLRIETGSPERGVEELRQVGKTLRLVLFDNPSNVPWRSWAAEGLRRLDRHDEARVLAADVLLDVGVTRILPPCTSSVWLGTAGRLLREGRT